MRSDYSFGTTPKRTKLLTESVVIEISVAYVFAKRQVQFVTS
jgi:hypothetical protein